VKSIKNIKQLISIGLLLQVGINFAYNSRWAAEGKALSDIFNEKKTDSKLIIAAKKGNLNDLKTALNDPKVNINEIGEKSNKTALMLASGNGHKRVVEILLNKGANPHILGWDTSALREAVKENYVEIVKLLLQDKRVDDNFQRSLGYALVEGVTKGDKGIIKLLLDNDADPNFEGGELELGSRSALGKAVLKDHRDIVLLLLDQGANINMQSGGLALTALMVAASKGNKDIIKLLLDNGADPNLKDVHGNTALDWVKCEDHRAIIQPFMSREHELMNAVVNGDYTAVKTLIDAGVDVNACHKKGDTVLMTAAEKGYTDIVSILIDAGADVNARNVFSFTALIKATEKGSVEIVKTLIDGGAARDRDSLETACMIASHSKGKTEIAKLLIAESSKKSQ